MIYYFIDDFNDICRQKDGVDKDFAEVIDLVDLIEDINKFVEEIWELKVQYNLLREQRNEFHRGARENANRVGQLEKENKELQERNNRQAKQLDKLYKLIEKQDYKKLQNIIQDFKEAEEILKQEGKCLDD